jgi:hypothetical protein
MWAVVRLDQVLALFQLLNDAEKYRNAHSVWELLCIERIPQLSGSNYVTGKTLKQIDNLTFFVEAQ